MLKLLSSILTENEKITTSCYCKHFSSSLILLIFFSFLCAANLNAQMPVQIIFTEIDCKEVGPPTLTWRDVNTKLNDEFKLTISGISMGRPDNIPDTFAVTITGNITTVGDSAFAWFTKLKTVNIPLVKTVGEDAFAFCSSLESVDMPSVSTIGNSAFYNCNGLKAADMPSVTTIGNSAFFYCTSLESIGISSAITIGEVAFYNCTSLEDVEMSSVRTIEGYAFAFCISLKSVHMPVVATIGNGVFFNCSRLESITILNLTPPTLGTNVFGGDDIPTSLVPNTCVLLVANYSAVITYKNDTEWSTQFLPRIIFSMFHDIHD